MKLDLPFALTLNDNMRQTLRSLFLYNNLDKYDCLIIDSTNPWIKNTLSEALPLFLNKKININDWKYMKKTQILFKNIAKKECNNNIIIKENGIIFK